MTLISSEEVKKNWLSLGLCKERKNSKNPRLLWKCVGVGPRLTRNFFFGKIISNSPKPVLIFWSSIPCVICLYIAKSCWLLGFECSVHVSSKKKFGWRMSGWDELYPIFFGIFGFFLTLQSPLVVLVVQYQMSKQSCHSYIMEIRMEKKQSDYNKKPTTTSETGRR